MDHNNFQLMTDLVVPFKGFLTKLNYPTITQLISLTSKSDSKAKLNDNRTQSLAISLEAK